MSCCGQKRQQWQQNTSQQLAAEPVSTEPVLENAVALQFHGESAIMVKGPKTNYLYVFAAGESSLMVDGRDAPMILEGSKSFSLAEMKASENPQR